MKEKGVKVDWRVAGIAIIAIAFLEWCAIDHGLNGFLFSLAVGAIAGIGGFILRGRYDKS